MTDWLNKWIEERRRGTRKKKGKTSEQYERKESKRKIMKYNRNKSEGK